MPRCLTRPEISTRITIKVLLEARPGMTRQQLVAFFHVSTRTVTDAETILKQFQPFRYRVYRLGMRGTDCQGRRRSWF